MRLAKRVETLERRLQDRDAAMPLLDFRWDEPRPGNRITFKIAGFGIVDRLDGEPDDDYQARALSLCQASYRNKRELPLLKVFLPG
jgi:hypothetical protein